METKNELKIKILVALNKVIKIVDENNLSSLEIFVISEYLKDFLKEKRQKDFLQLDKELTPILNKLRSIRKNEH